MDAEAQRRLLHKSPIDEIILDAENMHERERLRIEMEEKS